VSVAPQPDKAPAELDEALAIELGGPELAEPLGEKIKACSLGSAERPSDLRKIATMQLDQAGQEPEGSLVIVAIFVCAGRALSDRNVAKGVEKSENGECNRHCATH
jgi:hypothetical protein